MSVAASSERFAFQMVVPDYAKYRDEMLVLCKS